MKILIPIKQAASIDEDCEVRDDGKDVDPDYLDYEFNEWDDYSWEAALRLRESHGESVEIIPMTLGPEAAEDGLRRCLAKGGERGIRVADDGMEGADAFATARVIAEVVKKEKVDLVFTGALSSDHGQAATGMCLAGLLDWPHIAVVSELDLQPGADTATVHRELEAGLEEELTIPFPAVMSIQLGINEPRYASLRGIKQAKAKPLDVLRAADLGLSEQDTGAAGSLSRVRKMYPPERGQAQLLGGTAAEQAAKVAAIIKEIKG